MRGIKIHILSLKSEICNLVKKTLKDKGYEVTCNGGDEITEEFISNFDLRPDCLILDKDIKDNLKKRIQEKLEDVYIVCLPSLNSESLSEKHIRYMTEPFKLSELRAVLEEIETNINSQAK